MKAGRNRWRNYMLFIIELVMLMLLVTGCIAMLRAGTVRMVFKSMIIIIVSGAWLYAFGWANIWAYGKDSEEILDNLEDYGEEKARIFDFMKNKMKKQS